MILFASGLALVLAGGLLGFLLRHRGALADRLFTFGVVSGCAVALVPALAVLFAMPDSFGMLSAVAASGRELPFGIDAISAWFLVPVLVVGAAAAAFGSAYLAPERSHRPVALAHLASSVLVVGMAGVVTSTTIVAFLTCWEVMALCAYLLVVFEHEHQSVRRAGMVYMVLTHTCTLALLAMFTAWTGGHVGARFDSLAPALAAAPVAANLVLTLALVGFGIKAGLVPFHFWLPDAHSAAPTHVSAVMSGVMIKMGVYGLVRVLSLVGTPPAWWGWLTLLLGLASAILGVLWALAQHDLKRLLAYHSVENIGIIFMGLGVGALGSAYRHPVIALLGYAGALLHTLNHALFKSLLFLGAGAAARAGGTREIDRLGGLAARVPRTAFAFLVGSAAIVGLPPLNGFVSEWLIFRGLLGCGVTGDGLRLASVAMVGLALTGGLALACFSKLYGVVFLGTPRQPSSPAPAEGALAPPQLLLAAACVAIGLAPALLMPALLPAAAALWPGIGPQAIGQAGQGTFEIGVAAAVLLGVCALAWWARRLTQRGRARASAPTWGCAYTAPTARMQYTASSYAAPLLAAFGPVAGSRTERTATAFRTHPIDLVLDRIGRPLWQRITNAAGNMRILQSGGIRWYLLYSVICLLGMLLYLRLMGPQ